MRLAKALIVAPKREKERELEKKPKTQQKDNKKFESLINAIKDATNFSDIHKKLIPPKFPAKIHKHKSLAKGSHDNHPKNAKSKKNSHSGNGENDRIVSFFINSSKIITSKHPKNSENHSNLSHFKRNSFDIHSLNSRSKLEQSHKQPQKIKGSSLKNLKELKKSKERLNSPDSTHEFKFQTQNMHMQPNLNSEKDSSHKSVSLGHSKKLENHLRTSYFNRISSNMHVTDNQNTSTHQNDEKLDKNTATVKFHFRGVEIGEQERKSKDSYDSSQKKTKPSSKIYKGKEIAEESTFSSKNTEHKNASSKKAFKLKEESPNFPHFQKKKENELKRDVKVSPQEHTIGTSQSVPRFQEKVAFSIPKNGQINQNDVHEVQTEKNVILANTNKFTSGRNKKDKLKLSKIFEDDIRIKIEKGTPFQKKNELRLSRITNKVAHINLKKRELESYKTLPQVSREFTRFSQTKILFKEKRIEEHEILSHVAHKISQAIIRALESQKPPLKLEIKLNPPQLGKVSITVVEKAGKTFLTINAENLRTQELLKMVTPIIINQLSNLNFNVVDVQLNAQQWLENGNERHSRNNNGGREKQKGDGNFSDDFKETYEKEV